MCGFIAQLVEHRSCLNGAVSASKTITCEIPEWSILEPPLFLIYVNDMPKCLDYGIARLFADDANLNFSGCNLPVLQNKIRTLKKLPPD